MLPLSCALMRRPTWPLHAVLLLLRLSCQILITQITMRLLMLYTPLPPRVDLLLCQVVNTVSALGH